MKCFSTLVVAAGLALLAGCGPALHSVSGTVNYDGAALPEGDIVFKPKDAKVGPTAAKIKDGKYSVSVNAGTYRVEITASKMEKLPAGKKGPMGETEMPQQYIPEKYNSNSAESVDVAGALTKDFDLKSK